MGVATKVKGGIMKRIILAALVGVLVSGPGSAEAKTTFIECTNVGASIFGKERWDSYRLNQSQKRRKPPKT